MRFSEDIESQIDISTYKNSNNSATQKPIWYRDKRVLELSGTLLGVIILITVLFIVLKPFDNTTNNTNPTINGNFEGENLSLDNIPADFVLANNIIVNDVDIGGNTLAQSKAILKKLEGSLTQYFCYTVKVADKSVYLKSNDIKRNSNTEQILLEAVNHTVSLGDKAYSNKSKTLTLQLTNSVDSNTLKSYITSTVEKLNQTPQEASILAFHPWEEVKFDYVQSVDGISVDTSQVVTEFFKLYNAKVSTGNITAKATITKPKVTTEFLKQNIVPLSSAWTYSSNTEAGCANMKVALERSNGVVIQPHEVYSFSGYAGNTNLESEGYKAATVISGGRYRQEIGGGVCQAATTIYNAAVYANLGIVEREGHYWCSTYTSSGFDATISYGNIDLKLRNNTDYPIFLETKMVDRKLTCNIYGYQDSYYDDIATYSYNFDYYSNKEYSTRAYRVYLKNGVEIEREYLDTTTYSLTEDHYVVSADTGTIGAKPNTNKRSVYIAKSEFDRPLVDLSPAEPPTEPPTEAPTEIPTENITEGPTQTPTEPPTQGPTQPTEDNTQPSEVTSDPPENLTQ